MSELNRRLLDENNNIIYPITKAENIIHLQKTVLPKLSDEEPEIKVKGKVWLTPTEENDEEIATLSLTKTNSDLNGISYQTISNNVIYQTVPEITTVTNDDNDENNTYGTLENNDSNNYEAVIEYSNIQ